MRLRATMSVSSFLVRRVNDAQLSTPALLISTSIGPSSFSVRSTRASMLSKSRRSEATATARTPTRCRSTANRSSTTCRLPETATDASCVANDLAIAAPIAPEAPVTSATLPRKLSIVITSQTSEALPVILLSWPDGRSHESITCRSGLLSISPHGTGRRRCPDRAELRLPPVEITDGARRRGRARSLRYGAPEHGGRR